MLIGIFYSQIVESSSLVSILFREAISHLYISFFHLLVNGFSLIYIYIDRKNMWSRCHVKGVMHGQGFGAEMNKH